MQVRKPGHPAQLRRAQAVAVRADRRAAAQQRDRSECRDDADREAHSSSSASSRSSWSLLTAFLFSTFGAVPHRVDQRLLGGLHRRVAAGSRGHGAGRRHPGGHREGRVAAGRSQGAGEVRRRPQHQADRRHQGRDPLPQPRRRPLPRTRRRPGSTKILPAGSQIPIDRTAPALDLDLLLGGLKPVIQGLNPQDVNALTASLVQILQGQGGTLESLFSKTSSFTNALADNNQVIEQLIDNLNTALDTLSKDGDQFSGAIDELEQLVTRPVGGPRPDRHGHHVARQRHRLARRPARPGAATAGRHRRPAEPPRAIPRCGQGHLRRHAAATARQLPQARPGRLLRRVLPVLHLRNRLPGHRSPGPHRSFPWIKQETGRCRDANAQIPRIQPHQGRLHRRRPHHPRHRRRPAARAADVLGDRRCATRRCSPRPAASPSATT